MTRVSSWKFLCSPIGMIMHPPICNCCFSESGISGPLQDWLELNQQDLVGMVKALPTREDVQIPVEEQLIVELCSR